MDRLKPGAEGWVFVGSPGFAVLLPPPAAAARAAPQEPEPTQGKSESPRNIKHPRNRLSEIINLPEQTSSQTNPTAFSSIAPRDQRGERKWDQSDVFVLAPRREEKTK